MNNVQSGILAGVPKHSRTLMFTLEPECADMAGALKAVLDVVDGEKTVLGIGHSMVKALGKVVPGLRSFPVMSGKGFDIPSTPYALWLWLRGEDRGELYHHANDIEHALAMDFRIQEVLDTFMYLDSRDLTGYEDGTENPKGKEAIDAAIVQGLGEGLDGSSFVAVQQWLHDLDHFKHMSVEDQDNIVGRHIADNEEFDEAPESAHVKRAAQESFSPEAFMLRRSMPWTEGNQAGLNFIAFGKSFDAYEAVLNRMVGNEDGIVDAMFSFTRPISGAYYWCPPMKDGRPDLSALGI
ncbi:MAG: Dyp-type peroxidase [Gammaproteobacteria bacterium]|nr:Dyp-type peroxidase [Gammaproteobacteria bacterium]